MKTFSRLALCAVLVFSSTRMVAANTPKVAPQLTPAEQKAQAILRDVDAQMKMHKTMTADFVVFGRGRARYKGSMKLMKPNFSRVEYRYLIDGKQQLQGAGSDGKNLWNYPLTDEHTEQYGKRPLEPNEIIVMTPSVACFASHAFFGVQDALEIEDYEHLKYMGEQVWKDETFRVLQNDKVKNKGYKTQVRITHWLFVDKNNIVRRQVVHFYGRSFKEPKRTNILVDDLQLLNIQFDVPMTPQQFALQIPAGATQWKATPENLQKVMDEYETNTKATQ